MERTPQAELAALLASVELFQELDEPSRQALASELPVVQLAAGDALVRQGDDADSLFVILDGRLSILLDHEGYRSTWSEGRASARPWRRVRHGG